MRMPTSGHLGKAARVGKQSTRAPTRSAGVVGCCRTPKTRNLPIVCSDAARPSSGSQGEGLHRFSDRAPRIRTVANRHRTRRIDGKRNLDTPPRLSGRSRRRRWACAATRQTDREIRLGPSRELARWPVCYFVCKVNLVVRVRTQIRMSLKVAKRRCHLGGTRKECCKNFRWDSVE